MSAELELRWLKTESVKGAVRRFAEFCKEDVREQAKEEDFNLDQYQEAVKLVLLKLDNSLSLDEIFTPEADEDDVKTNSESSEEISNAD